MRAEPFAPRPDWFLVDADASRVLAGAPGLTWNQKADSFVAHRSLVALLKTEPAILTRLTGKDRQLSAPFSFADGSTLRDYQEIGRAFLSSRCGSLLADGMRVGKTPQIVAAHDPDSGPLVVVGPLAVRSVWLDWFRRRWPEEPVVVLRGRTYDADLVRNAKLIFTHYDILSNWVSVGLDNEIGTLVFDEAHALSNHKSQRTQNAHILATQAERVICATGTVIWNRVDGIWGMLNAIAPAAFGTYHEFAKRYAGLAPGAYGLVTGEPSNVEELAERMSEVMLRRRWADIRDELPPIVRNTETVKISRQEELQLDMAAAAIREAAGNPETVGGHLARIRRVVAKRKVPVAADAGAAVLRDGDPVVLWTWHIDTANELAIQIAKRGYESFIINGEIPEYVREDILDEWRAHLGAALIISMAVAPAGIDLSHAPHCIVVELDWTPATIAQAVMRTFSPDRPNFETYIVADHEVEYWLLAALVEKMREADQAGLPAADAVGQLPFGELYDFFGLGIGVATDESLMELADMVSGRIE